MKNLALALCLAVSVIACGGDDGPAPVETPVPEPTMEPVPTEAPTPEPPVSAGPCRQESFANVWRGDCAPSPTCVGPDSAGFYKGKKCDERP